MPVPLLPLILKEREAWRNPTLYSNDDVFFFASVAKNGSQPMQPIMRGVDVKIAAEKVSWPAEDDWALDRDLCRDRTISAIESWIY